MKNNLTASRLIDFSCITLLILIFISKISFKWAKIIPYSIPPLIFQYGLHPYINFLVQFFTALILIYFWIKQKHSIKLSPIYKIYIYSLIAILSIQTMFQITLVNIESSIMVQIAGLGMAIMLILVYLI